MKKINLILIMILFISCTSIPKKKSLDLSAICLNSIDFSGVYYINEEYENIIIKSNLYFDKNKYIFNLSPGKYKIIGAIRMETGYNTTNYYHIFFPKELINNLTFEIKQSQFLFLGEIKIKTFDDWTDARDEQKYYFKKVFPNEDIPSSIAATVLKESVKGVLTGGVDIKRIAKVQYFKNSDIIKNQSLKTDIKKLKAKGWL